jgi:hypothetical protein
MFATLQIDLLNEIKAQILAQTLSNDYTDEETRAYLDVVGIIDEKIDKVRYTRQPMRG